MFIFQVASSNTLDFWRNLEGSDLYLSFPLQLFCIWRFWEETPKLLLDFITMTARTDLNFLSNIINSLRSFFFWVDVPIQPLLSCGVLVWSSFSLGSLLKGGPIFWREYFVIASNVLGSIFPAFCYCCPLTRKVYRGFLPISLAGFISVYVPPILLYE